MLVGLAVEAEARRLALVVGIGQYQSLSQLANPVKDARAIADVLRSHGFEVSEHYDLTRADFLDALEAFRDRAKGAEVALVYYAGHGMEIAGRDVLAPADMEVSCEPKEARRAVGLDQLFEAAGAAVNQVVLLDSCRTDPFPQCPTRAARQGSGFRGLARVTTDQGAVLIANATLSGELAADGPPGEHSPFAAALLERFRSSPNIYFRDLLDQVALDVKLASKGAQIPEITARGGSPLLCLSEQGCGGVAGTAVSELELGRQAARLLNELGVLAETTPDPAALEAAIRKFQSGAGLAPDGRATPELVAVLGSIRLQGRLPSSVFTGKTEHPVGATFKDCDDCPDMVVLPAGEYTLGSPAGERGRQASEGPVVKGKIARPFAVSKLEITYDQWESCALEGGCNGYRPKDAGGGRGDRPVAYVSWEDAKAYVEWLRQRTGQPYRLLSEAEWEYAARANTSGAYATGEAISTQQANFDGSQAAGGGKIGSYLGQAAAAGSYPPNPFGLFDIHGNVAEWVEDCWNPSHAGAATDASPRGGDCSRRVAKGGAWYFEAAFLRTAARMSYPKDKRLNVVGFRIARDLD